MEAYRNKNKLVGIKAIDSKKMALEDGSQWQFLDVTPPPPSWQAGDQVIIEEVAGRMKSEIMHRVVNKTRRGHDVSAIYMGGGDSKEQVIEMNKSWEGYPDDRIGKDLKIDQLLEDGAILLEDASAWQLTNPTLQAEGEWEEGQRVRISKGPSKIKTYQIKNLNTGGTFFGSFMGFRG